METYLYRASNLKSTITFLAFVSLSKENNEEDNVWELLDQSVGFHKLTSS